jgi:hypothetical protein
VGAFSGAINALKADKKTGLICIHRGIHYGDDVLDGVVTRR